MTPVLVLTTVGAAFDAKALARELVELRVCACVNILPRVESIYRWEGTMTEDGEQLLLIKTVAEQTGALREALFARHPYDVPEFVVLRMDELSEAYREWLVSSSLHTG